MRVLIVEDDRALGLFLQKRLALEGHDVGWVGDGAAAIEDAALNPPSLVILDLGLPRLDGLDVLTALRQNFESTAVLVLTGRSLVDERIRCLDLGADDFVLKPFSFNELIARCRSLLRRHDRFAAPVLRFGGLEMDRMERTVSYRGVQVELTVKEFGLLEMLLLNKGGCCSRGELLKKIWHGTAESGTNIVDVYVTYLRKKLAAACPEVAATYPEEKLGGSVIETVRGQGYRLRDRRRVPRVELPNPAIVADRPQTTWTEAKHSA